MKKTILISLNVLLILPFLVFFRQGGNLTGYMLPVWVAMTFINTCFSQSIRQLIIYNGCLALFATIGIFVCGQLYFKYVCWDSEGELVIKFEMFLEIICITVLTWLESGYLKKKNIS